MSYTLLDHQKAIVLNVSKDKRLFEKELTKSLKWLNDQEQIAFKKWVWENFMFDYPKVINQLFKQSESTSGEPLKRKRITKNSLETA